MSIDHARYSSASISSERQSEIITEIEGVSREDLEKCVNIRLWECPNHVDENDCCQKFIKTKCPGWENNYFAFIYFDIRYPLDPINWSFQFDLVFEYMKKLYAYRCVTSFEKLKELREKIKRESAEGKQRFFPTKGYPNPIENKYLTKPPTSDERKTEDAILCTPSFPWLLARRASAGHVEKMCKYLQHLFSSPSLLRMNWFYEMLFGERSAEIVKRSIVTRAIAQLRKWRDDRSTKVVLASNNKKGFKNFSTKAATEANAFHTAYAVRRLLEQNGVFYHWALVFEGYTWLLRIELFAEHIKWVLEKNTPQMRRALWYDVNENFTKRWSVIGIAPAMRRQKIVHIAQIGCWIENWHMRKPTYSALSNNCQHFVRDMVAHFNTNIALDLNGLMDAQSGATLVPGMLMSHNLSQFTLTYKEWNNAKILNCPGLDLEKNKQNTPVIKKDVGRKIGAENNEEEEKTEFKNDK